MSLADWHRNGWLKRHATSPTQIADLFAIVDRDLADARGARLSADWQFGIAYNAALKLCAALLYAEGYRPEKTLAHYRTLQSMPLILGPKHRDDADYLDACRSKRNVAEYDLAGQISPDEAAELIDFATELRAMALGWLRERHPALVAGVRE